MLTKSRRLSKLSFGNSSFKSLPPVQIAAQRANEPFNSSIFYTPQRTLVTSPKKYTVMEASLNRSFSSSAETEVAIIPPYYELEFNTLVDLQINACKKYSTNKLFGTRRGNAFEWMTYGEFGELVEETRKVLKQYDIGVNDKVALICNNRVEWAAILYATHSLGGQVVPM